MLLQNFGRKNNFSSSEIGVISQVVKLQLFMFKVIRVCSPLANGRLGCFVKSLNVLQQANCSILDVFIAHI